MRQLGWAALVPSQTIVMGSDTWELRVYIVIQPSAKFTKRKRVELIMRYVRKNRLIYDFSCCKLCGTGWGNYPTKQCPQTICLLCGSPQCLVNGLGNGTCGICFHGLLPGWGGNDKICSFKNCKNSAVARGKNGKRYVCKEHFDYQFPNYLEKRLAERTMQWIMVED